MATFQSRLNELFDEAKDADYRLTKQEFARRFGATRSQVNAWLDGRSEPSIKDLLAIAKSHNTSVSWLLGETNIRPPVSITPETEISDLMRNLPPESVNIVREFILFIRHRQKRSLRKIQMIKKTSLYTGN